MFNYDIEVGSEKEFQRSSGVLVATPTGSSGWIGSAGLDIEENNFGFLARELYTGRHTPEYNLEKGLLQKDKNIKITCKTDAIVVLDSVSQEYRIEDGNEAVIKISNYNLKYVAI